MMLKQTKIVASISDLRCEVDFIRDLFNAGMNVVRMNTAHASREGFEKLISNVREVSNRIAILMDTKGPEVRTTASAEGPIDFKTGDKVRIVGNPEQETTRECIAVTYPGFVHDLSVGADVLIDDGELELKVVEKNDNTLFCRVCNDATLGSRKSVNVPGVRINLPSLTEKDRNNILYAIEKDIDFIAHSFVRNKQDVLDIREILDAHNSDIKIIAKIENQEGVDNIDEILEVADGVMVARGDLGIEVPQERIPGIQRQLIKKCILAKKPVIVATQMLHTMINNPPIPALSLSPAATACSACPPPKPRAAFTPRPARLRCSLSSTKSSRWKSIPPTFELTSTAPRARAASTCRKRTRPCVSRTFPPAWSWNARTNAASARTKTAPWPCSRRACTPRKLPNSRLSRPVPARVLWGPATAANASAPTTIPRGA